MRIQAADDHEITQGLKTILESRPEGQICAQTRTGREAGEAAARIRPDQAALDPNNMQELNGVDATRQIKRYELQRGGLWALRSSRKEAKIVRKLGLQSHIDFVRHVGPNYLVEAWLAKSFTKYRVYRIAERVGLKLPFSDNT